MQRAIDAVEAGASGIVHLTAQRACSWLEFAQAIIELAAIEVATETVGTVTALGSPDRPLAGVLARPRADRLGLPPLRGWREALEDYMAAGRLRARGELSSRRRTVGRLGRRAAAAPACHARRQ
jgi:dTDP-4-dehydrorhamnose reductase